MPLPKPNTGEKENEFIGRCMADEIMNKEYPDNKQRSAVCYSQWRKKEMKSPHFLVRLSEMISKQSEVKLLYPGKFEHRHFGKLEITLDDLKNSVKNFVSKIGTRQNESGEPELPFGYEHAASKTTDPEHTKASGWIKNLFLKDGALYAMVEWTGKAVEFIKNKEFRYVSAEFDESWKDENGKSRGFTILGATLSNSNFLKKNQLALALTDDSCIIFEKEESETKNTTGLSTKKTDEKFSTNNLTEDQIMDKELRKILGLKEDEDIITAVQKMFDENTQFKSDMEKKGNELNESKENLLTAQNEIKTLKDGKEGTKMLTDEEWKQVMDDRKTLIDLQKKYELNEITALVDTNIKEGKIIPAQKDICVKMALTDRKSFEEMMKNAKPIIEFKEKGSGNEGTDTDPMKTLDSEVNKYAREKKISYSEAYKILEQEKSELFKEYRDFTKGKE